MGVAFGTKLACCYGFCAVRSSLGQSSWGHRLSGVSLAVSAKSGARAISLRLSWCLSLDVGCSGVTKKQVAGKGGETPGAAAE